MKNDLFLLSLLILLPFQFLFSQEPDKMLLLGKVDYHTLQEFTAVDKQYARKPMFLEKETYKAFLEMYQAAKKEGIELKIISGARNFEHQKAIWERKWNRFEELSPLDRADKILEFSSMPSTSRHHWGTDIDLNSLENHYFEKGKGKAVYQWLITHAHRYGFYQVYTSKSDGRTGYAEEKWHWSYLPIANLFLERYNQIITYLDINGFEGAEWAEKKHMIPHYVNGVSGESQQVQIAALESSSTKEE